MGCWPLQRPRGQALGRRETGPPTKLRKKKKLEQLKVFYSGELNGLLTYLLLVGFVPRATRVALEGQVCLESWLPAC